MIRHIKPLPISEEMLGAYLEGNLPPQEAKLVEQTIQNNSELSAFVEELAVSAELISNYAIDVDPNIDVDFTLPEIPKVGIEESLDTHIIPLGVELPYSDIAVCSAMVDAVDAEDITLNNDMSIQEVEEIHNIDIDINNKDFPLDGDL